MLESLKIQVATHGEVPTCTTSDVPVNKVNTGIVDVDNESEQRFFSKYTSNLHGNSAFANSEN